MKRKCTVLMSYDDHDSVEISSLAGQSSTSPTDCMAWVVYSNHVTHVITESYADHSYCILEKGKGGFAKLETDI